MNIAYPVASQVRNRALLPVMSGSFMLYID
jgi:hypothetical protein